MQQVTRVMLVYVLSLHPWGASKNTPLTDLPHTLPCCIVISMRSQVNTKVSGCSKLQIAPSTRHHWREPTNNTLSSM
ncbi:hypothetical protein BDQ17DRAFT_728842 [Cyathus striatus]|nr:hypothetical protein BDQ17DRAFT_728842 [Cyathus striatus]